ALELPSAGPTALPLTPMERIRCCYYLRVMAQDRPGVLSKVAGILGDNNISIANVIQKGRGTREAVPVVMLTHEARERDMRQALTAIDRLPDVAASTTIRVEGGPAGGDLRLHGQHLGLRGGVRGARRDPRLRDGAEGLGRPRQALAGGDPRREGPHRGRQLRPGADDRPADRRAASRHARELGEPVPTRGA